MASLVYRRRSVEGSEYVVNIFFILLGHARRRDSDLRCPSSTSQDIPHLRLLHLLLPLLLDQLPLPFLD